MAQKEATRREDARSTPTGGWGGFATLSRPGLTRTTRDALEDYAKHLDFDASFAVNEAWLVWVSCSWICSEKLLVRLFTFLDEI